MARRGYRVITVKEEHYAKAEKLKTKLGMRSISSLIAYLIDKAKDKVRK